MPLREISVRDGQAPLVFIDTPESLDAYHLAGRYRREGNSVFLTRNLFHGEKKVGQFTASGSGDSTHLEQLTTKILKGMEKNL